MTNEYMEQAYDQDSHPTVCRHGPHPTDALLRSYGWAIASRPRRGPALWRKGGKTLGEWEALETCLTGEDG